MKDLLPRLSIQVSERTYLKDPAGSELGRRILAGSIQLIHELGFEQFTFRKLGQVIGSPEASIYRYFESKHMLLLYLSSWYWGYQEYRLVFAVVNVPDPRERLLRALKLLTEHVAENENFPFINEVLLQQIVIAESSKSYLIKEVDQVNKEGAFSAYKKLVQRLAELVLEVAPRYPYPHMLMTTVIEGLHHQRYFAAHLPRLTDQVPGEDAVAEFYKKLVFAALDADQ